MATREDSYKATASDSQKHYTERKARKLQEVLRGSDVSSHSLGVHHQRDTGNAGSNSR